MPRIVGLDHRGAPEGVGTPRRSSCRASRASEVPGSRYIANSSATTAASAGSVVTPFGSRGRSGLSAVPVGRAGPGQQHAGAQLGQPAAAHALGDQRALVLGHGAPDLQQQVVVRVVAHRAVEELGGAAGARPLLQQHHLVHVVAREAVGGGDEHAVDLAAFHGVAQAVEPRARQHGAAVAVVAEHVGRVERPALGGVGAHVRGQAPELLLNGLVLDLMAGRDTAVDRYAHGTPRAGSGAPAATPAPASVVAHPRRSW